MKYAVVDGKLTHVNKVPKGTIAREFGYSNYPVIACKGKYRSYWKYVSVNKANYASHLSMRVCFDLKTIYCISCLTKLELLRNINRRV